ncbi:sulfatase-like hydrolase/transferase [Candidatus Enterococcus clewellii]|uniref:Sulfatase N-terminal domain-containing protein n=1 Tax=Candidatus Enterococcus clewellii TaxID=1834193 RepID=A0A242KEA9_9ENTE|nr:sulfatase-like hydrolase/transferase [Enterococcus sp. 9E7_DIV0242]OTP19397.1 hypothetical protein A5888_001214 [Enterococcus sp. 9E7_DIV0242]
MSKKPNILFIVTDQQRKDTLSAYGESLCQTPSLDELAEQSLVFENAYTTCPICTPARGSMQTGLYPMHHGMLTNSYNYGNMVQELPDSPELLSRRLETAGYQIGYTGKWHLGTGAENVRKDEYIQRYMGTIQFAELDTHEKAGPTTVGYQGDDFPGHGLGGYIYPEYRQYLKDNELEVKIENIVSGNYMGHEAGEITSGLSSTIEHYLVERSKHWLDQFKEKDDPWFFQLNFWGPHEPYYAPTEFLDLYRDVTIEPWQNYQGDSDNKPKIHDVKRANDTSWKEFEPYLKHYYANMTNIDYQIGRLIDYLKENQLYEDTLIVFISDHGESLGIHDGLCDKAIFMYEEIVSIPMLIKSPQQEEQKRTPALVNLCDLYSTILEAAGWERSKVQRDGYSLMPILAEEQQTVRESIVVECSGIGSLMFSQRMLRKESWKYVFNSGDIDELYDLAGDPGELINLIDEQPEKVEELQGELEKWMEENQDNLIFEFRQLRRR